MSAASNRTLSVDARRTLFVYNLAFPFVFLGLLPGFLWRLLRRGNYRDCFEQRLGIYTAEDRSRVKGRLWIHSISVGETLVALRLAREIHARSPDQKIVMSATTSTGFALIREAATDWLAAIYNPIDFLPIVRSALNALEPAAIVLIEGEAWPNLVAESHRRGLSIILANARLSPRSANRFRRFRAWTGPIFRMLDAILLSDPEDLECWERLGAPRERLHLTGNIKFDQPCADASRADEFRALIAPLGVQASTPVLLAGSTFEGEEEILVQTFLELRRGHPDLFLIIVPRHVERTADIFRRLAPFNLQIIRRSALPVPSAKACDVLLVDSTGELRDWYYLATVVFIGKSLAEIGGQNPAEAVIAGKPVVFGPHMENFELLAARLVATGGAIQIRDAAALTPALAALFANEAQRAHLSIAGQAVLEPHQGATARSSALIAKLI